MRRPAFPPALLGLYQRWCRPGAGPGVTAMQIHALIYFNEVVRTRSFRKAAAALGVAPTAISRQVENLEHYFGAPLLERGARGIRLTAAGELLAARAARTLRDIDVTRSLIADLKGLQGGAVTVYAGEAIVSGLLAPALADFSVSFPKIRFEIVIATAGAAVEALAAGAADMALTLFAPAHAGVQVRFSTEQPHAAIMAPSHALAQAGSVTVADLCGHALAVPNASYGARQALDAAARDLGCTLDPVYVTGSLEMQKELARRGAAILVLPEMTVRRECEAGELVAIPIREARPIRTRIDLCAPADRAPSFAATRLLDFLERRLRALAETDRAADAASAAVSATLRTRHRR